ncbi:MAG: SCO family protein [Spirochaetia bacterium]|nr:SCO family protein [Spirochaetia bacterium]
MSVPVLMILRMLCLMFLVTALPAEREKTPPGVGVIDHRKQKIPLSLEFKDEDGRTRKLGDFFKEGRPVVLAPAYYNCPRLCTYVYNGLRDSVAANLRSGLNPGKDYQIVSFSFNPEEKTVIAGQKGSNYRKSVDTGTVHQQDWPFLTGDAANIEALNSAIGYQIKKDGPDFSHPSAIVILTPDGTISRYMYGVDFPARTLRLSLVEASAGRIGSAADSVMLFCFRYDDQTGAYTPYAWAFVRITSVAILGTLLLLIFLLLRKDKTPRNP